LWVASGAFGATGRTISCGRRVTLWVRLVMPFLRAACGALGARALCGVLGDTGRGALGATGRAVCCWQQEAVWVRQSVPFLRATCGALGATRRAVQTFGMHWLKGDVTPRYCMLRHALASESLKQGPGE
jgi:hypothetical protein